MTNIGKPYNRHKSYRRDPVVDRLPELPTRHAGHL